MHAKLAPLHSFPSAQYLPRVVENLCAFWYTRLSLIMASRAFSARAFLSLSAGVDNGSESESSEDFDDDQDRLEAPVEGGFYFYNSTLSLIVVYQTLKGPLHQISAF